jgi:hypothetical protein
VLHGTCLSRRAPWTGTDDTDPLRTDVSRQYR